MSSWAEAPVATSRPVWSSSMKVRVPTDHPADVLVSSACAWLDDGGDVERPALDHQARLR